MAISETELAKLATEIVLERMESARHDKIADDLEAGPLLELIRELVDPQGCLLLPNLESAGRILVFIDRNAEADGGGEIDSIEVRRVLL